MDVIRISNWSNLQVLDWFEGLDESLHRYIEHLRVADLIGEQLLVLNTESLHKLQINLVGHQELILDAVSLLQQLDNGLGSDTLQSRSICLNCRCRAFRSSINSRRRDADDEVGEMVVGGGNIPQLKQGSTNHLLRLAGSVLEEGKQVILWLERSPFNGKPEFREIRTKLVRLCYELSVTMQQSVFACVIEDASLAICCEIETTADGIIQSSDPLVVQPVTLERVCFRDIDPAHGIGIFIKVTFEGHHVVTGTRAGSVASKSRRITSGDELIAVNGRTVIGWTLSSLVSALKEKHDQVTLLLRKRPQMFSSSSSYSFMMKLREQEQRDRTRLWKVPAPIKRIDVPLTPPTTRMKTHHQHHHHTATTTRTNTEPLVATTEQQQRNHQYQHQQHNNSHHHRQHQPQQHERFTRNTWDVCKTPRDHDTSSCGRHPCINMATESRLPHHHRSVVEGASSNGLCVVVDQQQQQQQQQGNNNKMMNHQHHHRPNNQVQYHYHQHHKNISRTIPHIQSQHHHHQQPAAGQVVTSTPCQQQRHGKNKTLSCSSFLAPDEKRCGGSMGSSLESRGISTPPISTSTPNSTSTRKDQQLEVEIARKLSSSRRSLTARDSGIRLSPPTLTEEPNNPIDILKIPPPPSEPYEPKSDPRQARAGGDVIRGRTRPHSPNSLLDMELQRRHTVIGNATVDEAWYQTFLNKVRECNAVSDNNGTTTTANSDSQPARNKQANNHQDFKSSTDDVFVTSQQSLRHSEATVKYPPSSQGPRSPQTHLQRRPLSMPANCFRPLQRESIVTKLKPLRHQPQSCAIAEEAERNRILTPNNHAIPTREHFNFDHHHFRDSSNDNSYFSLNNSNNNNNNTEQSSHSRTNSTDNSGKLLSPGRRNRAGTPPKPPPRSSSKIRNSADLSTYQHHRHQNKAAVVAHPRQSSLPCQVFFNSRAPPTAAVVNDTRQTLTLPMSNQHQNSPPGSTADEKGSLVADDVERPIPKPRTSISRKKTSPEHNNEQPHHVDTPTTDKPRTSYNHQKRSLQDISPRNKTFSGSTSLREMPRLSPTHQKSPEKRPGSNSINVMKNPTLRSLSQDDYSISKRGGEYMSLSTSNNHHMLNIPPNDAAAPHKLTERGGEVRIIGGQTVRLRAKQSSTRSGGRLLKGAQEKTGLLGLALTNEMRTQRRVSCRDLGQGDCEGWLWKKKTDAGLGSSSSPAALSSKWSKRWVVIKNAAIYCFRSNEVDDERRAECYIRLPGYQVMPASECKRKFAFRIGHPKRKTFFFAAERQMDMSRWMNKMGLAAIEYQYDGKEDEDEENTNSVHETKKSKADDYVSESDNDDDQTDTSSTKEQTTETNNNKEESGDEQTRKSKHVRKKSQSLDNLIDDSVPPRSGSLTTSKAKSSELLANEHRSSSVGGDKDLEKIKRSAAKRVQSQSSGSSGGMLSSLLNGRLRKPTSSTTSPNRQQRNDKRNKFERRSSPGGIGGESNSGHKSAPGTPPSDGKYRLSYDPSIASTSASTSSRNSNRSSTASLASSSRRDTMGRPQSSGSYTHIDSELARECSSMAVVDENKATENDETMQASVQDLCKAIKNAEVDINGIDRRTSLRRKMTLLSRDPNKNEKMLKKRALERELKAKEQELEYYNKLLSDGVEAVTHERLHQWVNQHLSLVADIGTIRDMTRKHQRKTVTGADFVEPVHQEATTSHNRNNNNNIRRPRSCAMTDIDPLVSTGAGQSDDHPIATRVTPKTRLASSRRSYYLETDL